ncbi:unnamed protein product [Bemisia tabaci]|uniref:Uncharacterized protein n=1 Tax=Bemisia tabaci TaxID=7038 RepID=A0A9P0F5X2_BEMTA|nr:unnamed protein product [Bemisia tabaci]
MRGTSSALWGAVVLCLATLNPPEVQAHDTVTSPTEDTSHSRPREDFEERPLNGDFDDSQTNGDPDSTQSVGDSEGDRWNGDSDSDPSIEDSEYDRSNGDSGSDRSVGGFEDGRWSGDSSSDQSRVDLSGARSNGDPNSDRSNGDSEGDRSSGDYNSSEASEDVEVATYGEASSDGGNSKVTGGEASGGLPLTSRRKRDLNADAFNYASNPEDMIKLALEAARTPSIPKNFQELKAGEQNMDMDAIKEAALAAARAAGPQFPGPEEQSLFSPSDATTDITAAGESPTPILLADKVSTLTGGGGAKVELTVFDKLLETLGEDAGVGGITGAESLLDLKATVAQKLVEDVAGKPVDSLLGSYTFPNTIIKQLIEDAYAKAQAVYTNTLCQISNTCLPTSITLTSVAVILGNKPCNS